MRWYACWSSDHYQEDPVGKTLFIAIASLSLLAGCSSSANKATNAPAEPKWKGPPYRLVLDTQAVKPNPAGVTLSGIKYTANPEALEKRITLVVHFDAAASAKPDAGPIANQMVMYPVDITATPEGALPADYLAAADKELGKYLGAYCVKGKIKVTVAIAQSSLTNQAAQAEMNAKRLSDWLPIEVEFKNPHPHC
jgi:hypothetical protein